MKTYKLWIDIEEHDLTSGEFRSLTDYDEASPVPIAEFSDLDAAVQFADLLSLDRSFDRAHETVSVN